MTVGLDWISSAVPLAMIWPKLSTQIPSQMPMTRLISCSMSMMAIWNMSRIFTMFSISSAVSEGFIPAAGSSSRSRDGLVARARTISSRRWAP